MKECYRCVSLHSQSIAKATERSSSVRAMLHRVGVVHFGAKPDFTILTPQMYFRKIGLNPTSPQILIQMTTCTLCCTIGLKDNHGAICQKLSMTKKMTSYDTSCKVFQLVQTWVFYFYFFCKHCMCASWLQNNLV